METMHVGRYTVEVTHLEKLLFPDDGITKGELIEYYRRIGKVMVPHLRERPLFMVRFPNGIKSEGFVQKNIPSHFPDWIGRVAVKKKGGSVEHIVCENPATLIYLANQACIDIHMFLSRVDKLEYPDLMVFDLDPPGEHFEPVCRAAKMLRNLLVELSLAPFVKTTGSRGLHVTVPLSRQENFDTVRAFAEEVCALLEQRHPELLTTAQRKDQRHGRIYLDTLRNAYAQTVVAPYAVRPRRGAPVATPLDWRELDDDALHAASFTMRNIFERLDRAADPWQNMFKHARPLGQARALLRRMKQPGERGDRAREG